jgi:hypothetical protein
MLLEVRQVSRKTPLDGKLEITPATAARLVALGPELVVRAAGREDRARLESMSCTCAKSAGEAHVHHFIESPAFTDLVAGTEVRVELAISALHSPVIGVTPVPGAPGYGT